MNKIELWKGCFEETASIDDVDIIENISKQEEILNFLLNNKDKISINDWKNILYVVIDIGGFIESEEEGYSKICESCGDYNDKQVYYDKP